MQYIQVTFITSSSDAAEMLMARLGEVGYDGFEETATALLAYVEEPKFNAEELNAIAADLHIAYETGIIPAQNWNALWESNFEPVVVDDFCTIRADFHEITVATPYEIIITPKMSFGTGHHSTTQLMITQMSDIRFAGKTVLDFGTGTGVLAILAEMLGAEKIIAIDNDEWSVENTTENIARNNRIHISVTQGSLEDVKTGPIDIILANINRNILLQYMAAMNGLVKPGGIILMSGLLVEDETIIWKAATDAGLRHIKTTARQNWIAMLFNKI